MSELQQRHEEFLVEERQRSRVESDRLMEEARLAFISAESDRVKVLKSKLRKEKSKRKREQEINEKLFTVKFYTIFNVSFFYYLVVQGTERRSGWEADQRTEEVFLSTESFVAGIFSQGRSSVPPKISLRIYYSKVEFIGSC